MTYYLVDMSVPVRWCIYILIIGGGGGGGSALLSAC